MAKTGTKPKPAAKPAEKKPPADKASPAEPAKRSAKLTDDERAKLKVAYAEYGAAEVDYRTASKAKKDAVAALADLVQKICEGDGPLFEEPDGEEK